MNEKTFTLIRRIYGVILSVSIMIAGICLIAGCMHIYYSGNGYSSQSVVDTFHIISIPIYVCIGLIIISVIFSFFNFENKKPKTAKNYNLILKKLSNTRDTSECRDEIAKLVKLKKIIKITCILVVILNCIRFLIYALNPTNFHTSQINESMINAMWQLIPCVAISLVFLLVAHYSNVNLTKAHIELLKALPIKEKNQAVDDSNIIKTNGKIVLILKIVIVVAAVGILIFGAVNGGFADVLTKAVNICTECIGLG